MYVIDFDRRYTYTHTHITYMYNIHKIYQNHVDPVILCVQPDISAEFRGVAESFTAAGHVDGP